MQKVVIKEIFSLCWILLDFVIAVAALLIFQYFLKTYRMEIGKSFWI